MATTTKKKSECPDVAINPVTSSQIHGAGFCEKTNCIAVQFKNKSGPAGLYHFAGSPKLFADFMASESKGRFFKEHLKPLDAIKVVPDDPEQEAA